MGLSDTAKVSQASTNCFGASSREWDPRSWCQCLSALEMNCMQPLPMELGHKHCQTQAWIFFTSKILIKWLQTMLNPIASLIIKGLSAPMVKSATLCLAALAMVWQHWYLPLLVHSLELSFWSYCSNRGDRAAKTVCRECRSKLVFTWFCAQTNQSSLKVYWKPVRR